MQSGWIPELFETSELGVSSAYEPELIPANQLPWMKNGRIRGGKPSTRPFLHQRMVLPAGNIQGVSYFSIQQGMIVAQISGKEYRLRINNQSFASELIPLPWDNSAALPEAWMQETVGSLVIQDGQSDAIIYDGSTARRSDRTKNEVPLGRMMAYGNGRLWVAINSNEVAAGDIKTRQFQSELFFTETTYFLGGGAFYFPFKLSAMGFVPASGAAGYGSLMVYGQNRTEGIRADIASRDLWPTFPGFIQPVLLSTGAASHYSLVEVNQDLFWRDGGGGIRSLRSAATDEVGGPGNAPISREVSRLTDHESTQRLNTCSAIAFDNRLLMTASPFINKHGFTSFKNLIALDFAPLSSMRGKAPPAYDGQWDGINFVRLVHGEFQGRRRAFAFSTDDDGQNRLWEFEETGQSDTYSICDDGEVAVQRSPVPMVIEYPRRGWGDAKRRKRLERCDVFLANLDGEIALTVFWRADNYQKWSQWDEVDACAVTTDPAVTAPHVWKNLLNQERPQTKTFTIPAGVNEITSRALHTGFEFQIRLVLRGKGKIHRCVVYASGLSEEQFADRGDDFAVCIENDITGNEIAYAMRPGVCNAFLLDTTGVNLIPAQVPPGNGDQYYNPSPGAGFLGIALWVSTGGTGRQLLHFFRSDDFTPGTIINFTSYVNGYVAPGVARTLFFTVITYVSNGASAGYEVPINNTLQFSSGDVSLSSLPVVNTAVEGYVFTELIVNGMSSPFKLKDMTDMGTIVVGDYTAASVTTRLSCRLPTLPIP